MATDWIQAICSILMVILGIIGVSVSLPKISKDINKNANERVDKLEQQFREHIRGYSDEALLDMWKRLIDLYEKDSVKHEYSNLDKNERTTGTSTREEKT